MAAPRNRREDPRMRVFVSSRARRATSSPTTVTPASGAEPCWPKSLHALTPDDEIERVALPLLETHLATLEERHGRRTTLSDEPIRTLRSERAARRARAASRRDASK
jgi:hypothetical protein